MTFGDIAAGKVKPHNVGVMNIVWLKAPAWQSRNGLLHGFLGRKGGRSCGPYASLNLSARVGDDLQAVKDNLCDLKRAVGIHDLRVVTMTQKHGNDIVEVTDKGTKNAGEADGMMTKKRELFLGVLTADCVPILFSARSQTVTAVAHAGWRGTMAGLAVKMVTRIRERFGVQPPDLEVALGPSIGPCCYEIQRDVSDRFLTSWKELAGQSLRERRGRKFLDLKRINTLQLRQAGVPPAQIINLGPCTSCTPDDFFSYRRDSADSRQETGRQLSFIGWL